RRRLEQLRADWLSDAARAGVSPALTGGLSLAPDSIKSVPGNPPTASAAASRAVAKSTQVERPVLRGMIERNALLESIGRDAQWSVIAALHAQGARLDQSSRDLMTMKDSELKGESLATVVSEFERAIAEDTVRNEYQ